MKKILLLFFIFIFQSITSFAQDDLRIVSLKPNITEILFNLGVGSSVVGVTRYCDVPPEAQLIKAKVGDYVHVDVEKVISLKPTLILDADENNSQASINQLKKLGLRVEVLHFQRLSDIKNSIRLIASLVHQEARGEQILLTFDQNIKTLASEVRDSLKKERLLFLVGWRPLVLVGGNNFLDDVLVELGVTQLSHQSSQRFPVVSEEILWREKPTLILDASMDESQSEIPIKVPTGVKIVRISEKYLRPAPSMVEGFKKFLLSPLLR